ncbi:MAG: FAD binding domain-containing protein [Burkholderiales bacterium]|nr:FAD binding domain-containing protein [Burkholderiales bacterium]
MRYLVAADLAEAIRLRRQTGFPLLAGGTDLYPALGQGVRAAGMIDISRVAALREPIRRAEEGWVIPALTTWTQLIEAGLPPRLRALTQAAREIGGRQVQNAGTVGGNICNASPAADGVAALLALEATVVLAGAAGERRVPLGDFILGNRRCGLEPGEILRGVIVPERSGRHGSTFRKLGGRRYLVISIVMVAVAIELDDARRVRSAGIAVGACADRALRLADAERRLAGADARRLDAFHVTDSELAALAPIDDVRGSAPFRRHAVKSLVDETVRELATELAS